MFVDDDSKVNATVTLSYDDIILLYFVFAYCLSINNVFTKNSVANNTSVKPLIECFVSRVQNNR